MKNFILLFFTFNAMSCEFSPKQSEFYLNYLAKEMKNKDIKEFKNFPKWKNCSTQITKLKLQNPLFISSIVHKLKNNYVVSDHIKENAIYKEKQFFPPLILMKKY